MTLRFKAFDAINAADLHTLIEDQVREDRYIDYKAAPVGRRDQDKKEFLADIASFANSGGGHLVFGMEDQQGLPSRLVGLPSDLDLDAETLRLENMIRDGIDPRVQGVRTRPVPLERGARRSSSRSRRAGRSRIW
jgi:Putative DNA-binding domain